MSTAAAILAKAPIPGLAKTRLVPPLTHDEAAGVARACLAETLRRFTRESAMTWSLYLDGVADEGLRALAEERMVPIRPQPPGDLGLRLRTVCEALRAEGHDLVLAVGSDSPTLPLDRLRDAATSLGSRDAVVGPTADGGYYLIGFSRPAWTLFEGIPWSTDGVLRATLTRAAVAGVSVALLDPWYDVDDEAGLRRALTDAEPEGPFARLALPAIVTPRTPTSSSRVPRGSRPSGGRSAPA